MVRRVVWMVLISCGLVFTPVTAQDSAEANVEFLFRHILEVTPSQTLRFARTYSGMFPRATFYWAGYSPPGSSHVFRSAAVVLVDGNPYPVQSWEQAASVWAEAIDSVAFYHDGKPDPLMFYLACSELVLKTHLVDPRARFLEDKQEIPRSVRDQLTPKEALQQVRPPRYWFDDHAFHAEMFVTSDYDLLRISCRANPLGALTVRADTLAHGLHLY